MDFINGFKMRLVHVDVMDLCSNPMRLSLRAQVSNPAHVRVKIGDLGMQLRGPQGALLKVSTSAPLLVPGRTKEANISVTLLMDTLLESDAAQALSDLQTNTALQEYEVVYGAGLDLGRAGLRGASRARGGQPGSEELRRAQGSGARLRGGSRARGTGAGPRGAAPGSGERRQAGV